MDDKAILHRYLKTRRAQLLAKLDGLDEYDVRRPMTPTGTNLLGLVKHVASVELGYFGEVFGRPSERDMPWLDDGAEPDADMWATPAAHRADIIALRGAEQRRAAELVGVTDIHYLHQRDGYLEASHEVMKGVVKLIREIRPDVVLSMHPERSWKRIQKSHPDHLAVGEAVTRAVYPALENPFAYPELAEAGLEAYKLPWLWLYAGPEERENHFVDVTEHVESKLRAIHVHVSQHPDVEAMEATVRRGMKFNAERAGLVEGRSAEAFHVVAVNGPGTIAGF